jgi:hypothetical protein
MFRGAIFAFDGVTPLPALQLLAWRVRFQINRNCESGKEIT